MNEVMIVLKITFEASLLNTGAFIVSNCPRLGLNHFSLLPLVFHSNTCKYLEFKKKPSYKPICTHFLLSFVAISMSSPFQIHPPRNGFYRLAKSALQRC